MFNWEAKNKTPTVNQIKAIIDYMIADKKGKYNLDLMMSMDRPEPNIVLLSLNDAWHGVDYKITFDNKSKINLFKKTSCWVS